MKSQKIIVRDVRGRALIRFGLYSNVSVVYITDAQGVKELQGSNESDRVLGFPICDVFMYPQGSEIQENTNIDWTSLRKWSDN